METAALNCALCNLFGSDKESERRLSSTNEAKNHARIHFGQIKMIEDEDIDEEQMLKRCFSSYPRKVGRDLSIPRRQSLIDLCHSLFGKRPKFISIDCNLCGCGIKIVGNANNLRTDNIINHARIHPGVKAFKCGRCEQTFRKRGDVQAHMKRVHGTKMTNNDFEDRSESFHDEILSSIKRCFSKCDDGAPSKEAKDKNRDEIAARSGRMTNASQLAVQRQSSFCRILKESVSSNGNVKCRLCSKKVKAERSVKFRGHLIATLAVQHAQYHLRKPLYRCKVCSESRSTYPAMVGHLKRKHKLGMEKNHECFADEFHTDILAVFAQCYEED